MPTKKRGGLFWVFLVAIVAVVYLISTYSGDEWGTADVSQLQKDYTNVEFDDIVVKFIDVGQGDCQVVMLPDGRNILIDGGRTGARKQLLAEIKELGITRFDYLVATHPHEDHIGNLDTAVWYYDIGEAYLPKASSASEAFEDFANALKENNVPVHPAKAGVVMIDEEDIRAEFLAPVKDKYEETNDYSAVLKLTYYGFSVIFTGDAEALSEHHIIKSGADPDADVLKVGHHGSNSSTSESFLKAVSPDYAIISVGEDNSYGHPHKEVLDRLDSMGIPIYRTDLSGTITLTYGKDGIDIRGTR